MAKRKATRNGEAVPVGERRGVDPDISGSWFNVLLHGTVEQATKTFKAGKAKVRPDVARAALGGTLPEPEGDWLILVELHGQPWMFVGGCCDDPGTAAEAAKSLSRRAKSRTLVVGHEDVSGTHYAGVYERGKELLHYESDGDTTRFRGSLRPRSWLRQFGDAEGAQDGIVRDVGAFVPEFRAWTEKGRIKIETGQPDVLTAANVRAVALVELPTSGGNAARANAKLLEACAACNVAAAREALATGADVNHASEAWTPLQRVLRAAIKPRGERALALLNLLCDAGVDLNGGAPGGYSAAEFAGDMIRASRILPLLKALHARGADLTLSGRHSRMSPMTQAAARGQLECVKYLQSIGIDVNATDAEGNNALQAAREHKRLMTRLGAKTFADELARVETVIDYLSPPKEQPKKTGGPGRVASKARAARGGKQRNVRGR